MEGSQGDGYSRWSPIIAEEVCVERARSARERAPAD